MQATTALLLDGMNVFERVIKVNMARGGSGPGVVRSLDPDRVQRTIHVGGLPFDEISEETLAEYFSHVGEVRSRSLLECHCILTCCMSKHAPDQSAGCETWAAKLAEACCSPLCPSRQLRVSSIMCLFLHGCPHDP